MTKKMLTSVLTGLFAIQASMPAVLFPDFALAQSIPTASMSSQVALDHNTNLADTLTVPGGSKKTSLSVSGESVRTVLRGLATQGGFNLVMDESVTGNISVELSQVTINQALQSVATLANLKIIKQNGGIYLAISQQAAQDKGIARELSKVIKVSYSNASHIADVLNRSLFASAGSSTSSSSSSGSTSSGGQEKVKADSRTNTLIVVGSARDIQLAESAVSRLDKPRLNKTFYLSHANALDVATMLSSSIFNDGTAALALGGSGSSQSSSGQGSTPSTMRVERQDVQEGSGINNFGGSSSSSGSSSSAGLSSSVTLRGFVKSSDTLRVSPEGALVIPDTRQNAITIMGTAEQIALAESLIPTMDAQLPQVSIEASLIEITETGIKELGTNIGIADGRMQTGFNNSAVEGVNPVTGLPTSVQPANTGLTGLPTVDTGETAAFGRSGIMFSTNPLARNNDYMLQIRSLITKNKAKVLANPTVIATHDTESIISIVDQVVRRVTVQLDSSGFATQSVELGEAGIVMDILPKIGEDGTINMRLRPSVTSVLSQTRDAFQNIVTLLSKRDLLTQNVRVQDGQTLVLGGLIQQTDNQRQDRMPFTSDLPIVGAMFRATQRNSKRSEIVLLITPHIINKTKLTPVNASISVGSDAMGGGQP